MLTELCQYLHNWFDRDKPKFHGKFEIKDGVLTSFNDGDMGMIDGQFFRIVGSLLNDGVHQFTEGMALVDEQFYGAVWFMAIPPAVVALATEIEAWRAKYETVDSAAMSPFTSESFGGYTYSKGVATDGSDVGGWQAVFAGRLNPWRKLG